MKNKTLSLIISTLVIVLTIFCSDPSKAGAYEYTVGEVQSLIDGIVDYKCRQTGSSDVQSLINGALADGAGRDSEWYVISLSQYGYSDFSRYVSNLENYLKNNNEPSATSREKYALALSAAGSTDPYTEDILNSSIGAQGIMSYIYGLHVLNNGYSCSDFNAYGVAQTLVSMQYGDGGWALFGEYGDIDVTSMTISALAPYYWNDQSVHDAVDRGVDFLSARQQENGGYQSFGTPNPESASQVLVALSAIGIDGVHDERFIKNGNCLIDGITEYRLDDGSFSHIKGDASNETATTQALYSLIAYKRMCEGRSGLYVFDNRRSVERPAETEAVTETPVTEAEKVTSENMTDTTAVSVTNISGSAVSETSLSGTATSVSDVTGNVTSPAAVSVTSVSVSSDISENISSDSDIHNDHKTDSEKETEDGSSHSGKRDNKIFIVLIIFGAAGVLCLVLFLAGKRNKKNFIFIIIAAAAVSAFVLLNDFSSKDDYYNGKSSEKPDATGTVTLEIRCDTIAGKSDDEHIPADGTVLEKTEFEIDEDDTVFDILTEAARKYNIQVENKGSAGSAHGLSYIAGINYIYEFDFGDLSGWVYHVNGITPSRGCGEYVLNDGDEIEWLYTCDLGHDLDEVYEDGPIS